VKASAINKIVMLGGPKAHAIKSWPVAHGLRPMDHGPWARQGPWAHGPWAPLAVLWQQLSSSQICSPAVLHPIRLG